MTDRLQAVIFDLDGVLCSTSRLHADAWSRLVRELGIEPPPDLEDAVRGISRLASLKLALGHHADHFSKRELEELAEKKNRYYLAALDSLGPRDASPGAKELLDALRASKIKIAVASASKNAKQVIKALGFSDIFDTVADGHSYRFAKPHPDIFLTAARMLGTDPGSCVVVEDAAAGIDAALDGGFVALGLGKKDMLYHAHAVVPRLDAVSLPMLTHLHDRFRPDRWSLVENFSQSESNPAVVDRFAARNSCLTIPAVFHFGRESKAPQVIRTLHSTAPSKASLISSSESVISDKQIENIRFLTGKLTLNDQPLAASSSPNHGTWRLDILHGIQLLSILLVSNKGEAVLLTQQTFADMTNPRRFLVKYVFEPINCTGNLTIQTGVSTPPSAADSTKVQCFPFETSEGARLPNAVCLTLPSAEDAFTAAASALFHPNSATSAEAGECVRSACSIETRLSFLLEKDRLVEVGRVCTVAVASNREAAESSCIQDIHDAIICGSNALLRKSRALTREKWLKENPDVWASESTLEAKALAYSAIFEKLGQ